MNLDSWLDIEIFLASKKSSVLFQVRNLLGINWIPRDLEKPIPKWSTYEILYHTYMGVSKNKGTPKSPILIGFSIINHPFWEYQYFWKHPYTHNYIYLEPNWGFTLFWMEGKGLVLEGWVPSKIEVSWVLGIYMHEYTLTYLYPKVLMYFRSDLISLPSRWDFPDNWWVIFWVTLATNILLIISNYAPVSTYLF